RTFPGDVLVCSQSSRFAQYPVSIDHDHYDASSTPKSDRCDSRYDRSMHSRGELVSVNVWMFAKRMARIIKKVNQTPICYLGAKATKEQVMNAAREIYKDHPEILKALELQ